MKHVASYLLLLALGALFLAGCAGAAPAAEVAAAVPGEAAANTAVHEATFTAVEYAYKGPQSIPGGWTRLTLDNQGALPHDLIVVRLGEGKTAEDVLAALEAEGPPAWATLYGQVSAEAGRSASYLAELAAGDYAIFSFGAAEDGPPDAALGMIDTFTVTAPAAPVAEADLPAADLTVDLADYSFVVSGAPAAGERLVKVRNTGTELHELVLFRLHEGTTLADFQAMLAADAPPAGEPPFTFVSSTMLSPGLATYMPVTFDEPGTYALVCFLDSAAHAGQTHTELGMVQELVVP